MWQAGLTRLKVKQGAERSDGPLRLSKSVGRARRTHSAEWQKAPKARAPGAQKRTRDLVQAGAVQPHQAARTPYGRYIHPKMDQRTSFTM